MCHKHVRFADLELAKADVASAGPEIGRAPVDAVSLGGVELVPQRESPDQAAVAP